MSLIDVILQILTSAFSVNLSTNVIKCVLILLAPGRAVAHKAIC